MLFKMLGSIIYCIIDKYDYLYYLCLLKENLSLNDNSFENSTFDNISGTGITELLTNIMYCHSFRKEENTIVILT